MKEITVIQFAKMIGISDSSFKQKRRAGINGWELCPKVIARRARADLFCAEKAQEFKEIILILGLKPKPPRDARIPISYSGDALKRIMFLQPKLTLKLAEKPKPPRGALIPISYSGDALKCIMFLQPKLRLPV